MRRTLARELPAQEPGSQVTVQGWVHRRRALATVTFVVVRDRTGLAQVVVKDEATLAQVAGYGEETVLAVTGTVTANPAAPGGFEVTDPVFEALSAPSLTPPVELWRPSLTTGLPTQLDHAGVSLRHRVRQARWQLAAASLRGFRETLDARDFTEVHSPKLVASATESGANVFEVDYFGRPAYLAQSPQFYKQVLVGVFERVYEVGPVFRAEPHDTVRHLAEYVSLDVELGFVRDHRDVVAVLRDTVAGVVAAVAMHAAEAVSLLDVDLPFVPEELPVVHFRQALEIAGAPADEPDLAPAHERAVGAWAKREHGSDLVVVEGYPTAHRAFYSHPDPCCSAGSSWSAAHSGCIGTRTTSRPSRPAATTRSRTRRTSTRSGTACHRTAASRSGWSAGSAGWSRHPTSGRSRSSPATCTGWVWSPARRSA